MRTSSDHILPTKIALGVDGSEGIVIGFMLPDGDLTTYWISIDDARSILRELPRAIEEAEKAQPKM